MFGGVLSSGVRKNTLISRAPGYTASQQGIPGYPSLTRIRVSRIILELGLSFIPEGLFCLEWLLSLFVVFYKIYNNVSF